MNLNIAQHLLGEMGMDPIRFHTLSADEKERIENDLKALLYEKFKNGGDDARERIESAIACLLHGKPLRDTHARIIRWNEPPRGAATVYLGRTS